MTIQDMYNYCSYYKESYVSPIQNVSVEGEKQETLTTSPSQQKHTASFDYESKRASKSANLENISLTFVADETFGYIGRDRNVENLDVMQAVSDMQKDSVLHQYHTFVSMEEPIFSSADGMVFLK